MFNSSGDCRWECAAVFPSLVDFKRFLQTQCEQERTRLKQALGTEMLNAGLTEQGS